MRRVDFENIYLRVKGTLRVALGQVPRHLTIRQHSKNLPIWNSIAGGNAAEL